MKRIVFSIIIAILAGLFIVLYAVPAVRTPLMNLSLLTSVYSNLDKFFCFIWPMFLGNIIKVTPSPDYAGPLYGIITVSVFSAVLILMVDLISTILYKVRKRSKDISTKAIEDETELLTGGDSAPKSFSQFNSNIGSFANMSAPYVSLSEKSISGGSEKVEVNRPHTRPSVRIVLSIIYGLLVLFILFLRFVSQNEIPYLDSTFGGLLNLSFPRWLNQNLLEAFSSLFAQAYVSPMAVISGSVWTWGEMYELFIELVGFGLLWAIVLVICHLCVRNIRRDRSKVSKVDVTSKNEGVRIDEGENTDVNYIARITPYSSSVKRNQQLEDKSLYIDDIGEYTVAAGTRERLDFGIAPSPIRQPLSPEELSEDLSENASVTIRDIASIEDSFKKKSSDTISIETSFPTGEDYSSSVDLSSVRIDSIVIRSPERKPSKEFFSSIDDMISFDEDGYAYLVKKGKPFASGKEDISDVVVSESFDKTAVIARFGRKTFEELNGLEPFVLRPLNYDEEVKNISIWKKSTELMNEEDILRTAMAKKPFSEFSQDIIMKSGESEEKKSAQEGRAESEAVSTPESGVEEKGKGIIDLEVKSDISGFTEIKPEPETIGKISGIEKNRIDNPSASAPIKPVTIMKVSYKDFMMNKAKPVEKATSEEASSHGKEISEDKKDLTKVNPKAFFAVSKPAGPIDAKIISIEDYLGRKKK